MSDHRPAFRSDIEGLRGVAILLVVLFHAGVSWLSGGFVGVDVFFVLSGFFITGPLVRELAASGRIDLADFYWRRALRLLPVLLVVLVATLAVVSLLYAPIDRAAIATTAKAVAFSAGNIEFARASVNYFGGRENPLLHTWSLGVEQQFYLVWPLLLMLFAYIAGRWPAAVTITNSAGMGASESSADASEASAARKYAIVRGILIGIAVAGLVSFAASVWITNTSQPWAFFGLPTRIWEFALGGVMAMMATDIETNSEGRRFAPAAVLQAIGLTCIAIAVLSYDRIVPYPGFAALLPAIGAVLMLAAGSHGAETRIGQVLRSNWLQWLGRMSYAWYLWHWPLMGLGRVIDPGIGVVGRLVWAAVALVLAWLTYRYVEKPARAGKVLSVAAEWLPTAAFAATVGVALLAHFAMRDARRVASRPDQRAFAAARNDRMKHDCWVETVDNLPGECAFGDTRSSTVIALLGDSHAEHWLGALDRVGRERGWKIVAMVKGGCPVPDMSGLMSRRTARNFTECDRYREAMLRRIVAMRPAAVVLSSWDHYVPVNGRPDRWQVTTAMWEQGLRRTYSRLAAAGVPTVAIRGTPRTPFDVPECLSRRVAGVPFSQPCVYSRDGSVSGDTRAAQTAAARGLPIRFVDMNDQVCSTSVCSVVRDGTIIFTDDNHLTASFSRMVAPVLGDRLQAALGSTPRERVIARIGATALTPR